jgi:hypothetical protein
MFNGLYDNPMSKVHAATSLAMVDREAISNDQRWHSMRARIEVKAEQGKSR